MPKTCMENYNDEKRQWRKSVRETKRGKLELVLINFTSLDLIVQCYLNLLSSVE